MFVYIYIYSYMKNFLLGSRVYRMNRAMKCNAKLIVLFCDEFRWLFYDGASLLRGRSRMISWRHYDPCQQTSTTSSLLRRENCHARRILQSCTKSRRLTTIMRNWPQTRISVQWLSTNYINSTKIFTVIFWWKQFSWYVFFSYFKFFIF